MARAAQARSNEALIELVRQGQQQADQPSPEPAALQVSVDGLTPEGFRLLQNAVTIIRQARLAWDAKLLDELAGHLGQLPELPGPVQQALRELLGAARDGLKTRGPADPAAGALNRTLERFGQQAPGGYRRGDPRSRSSPCNRPDCK